jgi:tetratricopeptide (TPR) repeat protein
MNTRVRGLALLLAAIACTAVQAQTLAVTTASGDARRHYDQGIETMLNVDLVSARGHFDAAVQADPEFALAYAYRAFVSPPAQRAEWMGRATEQASHASEGERAFIAALTGMLDGPQGLPALAAVAADYPGDAYVQYVDGTLHFQNGESDAAAAAFERAIAINPNIGGFHNLAGYTELERGNHAAAEAHFRHYIALEPNHANSYDSLGEFYLRTGRLDEAETQLRAALDRDPEFEASLNNLAWVGVERGNLAYEQAVTRGDAEAIGAIHTPGTTLLPPGAAAISGRSAVVEFWAGAFAQGGGTMDFNAEEVVARDNMAYERGTYHFAAGDQTEDGKYLAIWLRGTDGVWRIHRDAWNATPASHE